MQKNGLIALLAVTVVVAGVAIWLALSGPATAVDANSGKPVFADLDQQIGKVAAIKISGTKGKVTIERQGVGKAERWIVAEKSGYPADAQKVRQTLLGFAELKFVEAKTREPASYARLDVEDPGKKGGRARLVELDDPSGKAVARLIVGKRRPDILGAGADGLYIRRPGEAQSWLAQGTVDLPDQMTDWLDKKVAAIPAARIEKVVLSHDDGSVLVIQRDKAGAKFAVADAPANTKFKSDDLIAEPAGVLDGLELTDVRKAADMPFPEKGVAKAAWTTFDGLTVTGTAFEKDGTGWLKLHAEGSDEKSRKEAAALDAKFAPWVFGVYPYKTHAMMTKLADLVEPAKPAKGS